jgi:acetyl-CoA carboxylase carboxyl transferase beta subunit
VTAISAVPASSLWIRCPGCEGPMYGEHYQRSLRVCSRCGHHDRLSAPERMDQLLDAGSTSPLGASPTVVDPLDFTDTRPYLTRLEQTRRSTGLQEAVVCATASVGGHPVVAAVMDFGFMGGSLGCAVGERITAAAEHALATRTPLAIVTASGGARMQEGTLALMQLAKTCAILERLRAADVPYVSVMSDPTTGGVFASYAVLGDVNLAEPNALIGFAGARVAAGTIAQELPPGFQRSEFLFEHGFIDRVVHRRALRGEISSLLRFMHAPALPPAPATSAFSPIGAFLSTVVSVASGGTSTPPATGERDG